MLDLLNKGIFQMFYIFTGQVMETKTRKPRQRVGGAEEDSLKQWGMEGGCSPKTGRVKMC